MTNLGIESRLRGDVGVAPAEAGHFELMSAAARAVREQLSHRWLDNQHRQRTEKVRRVYYMSMEFLIGRMLGNALDALELTDAARTAFAAQSRSLEETAAAEPDPGLGNGGLGRLAACFLDSLATEGIPSMGYGIRYEYGMFAQAIQQGRQVESTDPWLANGTPWEFPRVDVTCRVGFGGVVEQEGERARWKPAGEVLAKAYDLVVPGHQTSHVSTLRLWRATAPEHIDLNAFNRGDYARAAVVKNEFENISWVLYPNDSTPAGRELRLRQEYFFVAASLHDILERHRTEHDGFDDLAEYVAVHLNDTHPAIGVAELMRLLCDEHRMPWERAWAITQQVFSYTNHTLMPEALETWPVDLVHHVLPRHLEIIYRINQQMLDEAALHRPGDGDFLARLSLIDERGERRVRMAHLSIVGSHRVNGVSSLHSDLLVQTIFSDFASLWPERFTNVTNGVTPRRWLAQANRPLSKLIDSTLGKDWRVDLDRLQTLRRYAGNADFREAFMAAKEQNKQQLAELIAATTGVVVDPSSLFDVQVKRIHEYKRQLLNVLHVITRYQAMLAAPQADWLPRTVIFAGKAASSYAMAKQIIHLINDVTATINADPRLGGRLKVVFIPNYGVSIAERIMPGADLSEQISTAGTEASGTGNMKLALNGALTIGTLDGANIEILERVGEDNIFIFGLRTAEVTALRRQGYRSAEIYETNTTLRAALDAIAKGVFSPEEPGRHLGVVDALVWGGDHYLLLADYDSYIAAQHRVDALYRDRRAWATAAIRNVAGMGIFSSDRAIREYARRIWRVEPRR